MAKKKDSLRNGLIAAVSIFLLIVGGYILYNGTRTINTGLIILGAALIAIGIGISTQYGE